MENGAPNGASRWRFTKDIPLSLVLAFVLQTVALVWFLAGQNAALNNVIKLVSEAQATAYTKEDARHEREFQEVTQRLLNNRTDDLLRRISILETQTQSSQRIGVGINSR